MESARRIGGVIRPEGEEATGVHVGIPKEVKDNEYRVAATPEGVRELTKAGHRVVIEASAGEGSAIADEEFLAAGAPDGRGTSVAPAAVRRAVVRALSRLAADGTARAASAA